MESGIRNPESGIWNPESRNGIMETEKESETEYGIRERRFQAINLWKYISNDHKNKWINLIPGPKIY